MTAVRTAFAAVALAATVSLAEAKPARCYNSDDGFYACEFEAFCGGGSVSVSAPTEPTYTISLIGSGVADGFADYGGLNIALPGVFHRNDEDRACGVSDATEFTLCAY